MSMQQRAIIMTIILFGLIVLGMFTFAYLKRSEIQQQPAPTLAEPEEVAYPNVTRVDAKHFFIDGVHTVAGEIEMPTPCDLLEAELMIAESYPEQVTIDFTVINEAEFCAQVITPARFKVETEVSEEATWNARFMGRQVELNLIPAGPGETPDDFELFQKG